MNFVKTHKGLVAGLAAVVLIFIVVASFIGSVNSTRNTLIDKEQALVFEYNSNQTELSAYTNQVAETLGVAETGTDKIGQIMVDAVSGRYDNMEPGTGGALFSSIAEDYPDFAANTAQYTKIQDLVISGRNQFKNKQNALGDRARDYQSWTKKNFIRSFIVKNVLGAPTEDLKITIGKDVYRGQDALDKLTQPIMSSEAIKSFDTGVSDPVITSKK